MQTLSVFMEIHRGLFRNACISHNSWRYVLVYYTGQQFVLKSRGCRLGRPHIFMRFPKVTLGRIHSVIQIRRRTLDYGRTYAGMLPSPHTHTYAVPRGTTPSQIVKRISHASPGDTLVDMHAFSMNSQRYPFAKYLFSYPSSISHMLMQFLRTLPFWNAYIGLQIRWITSFGHMRVCMQFLMKLI